MGRFEELGTALDLLFGKMINKNFSKADEIMQKTEVELSSHKSSGKAHNATAITYEGDVVGAETAKQAIDNVQTQLNAAILSGDSSPAAAQAAIDASGHNYGNLKLRLDTENFEVMSQLAETAELSLNTIRPNKKTKKCIVTFITDDGHVKDLTLLAPLFIDRGVPLTLAIPPNYAGNIAQSYLNDLLTLQKRNGFEFVSHTFNHINLTTIPESQIEFELTESQNWLKDHGFKGYDIMVYPQGGNNELVRKLTRKYYKVGIGTLPNNGINEYPLRMYDVARVGLGSYFNTKESGSIYQDPRFPADGSSLEYYKARVDFALENSQWLIFMIHPWHESHTATQQQYIADTIDYIKSLNIPIMRVSEALNVVGNVVDVGDYHYSTSREYTVTDAEGKTKSAEFNKPETKRNLINNNKFEIGGLLGHTSSNVANLQISLDTEHVKSGKYSIKAERLSSVGAYVITGIPSFSKYTGKKITVGAWLMCPKTNKGDFKLGIQDGVTFSLSDPVPKDDNWHFVTVSHFVSNNAVALQVNTGRTTSNSVVGDVMFIDSLFSVIGDITSDIDSSLSYVSTNLVNNAEGTAGQIAYNESYLFLSSADNTWRRMQLSNNEEYRAANSFSVSNALTDFPQYTITVCSITTAYAIAQGFPEGIGGTFWTYNTSYDNEFKYQIYETIEGKIYRRGVNTNGTWKRWKKPNYDWVDV